LVRAGLLPPHHLGRDAGRHRSLRPDRLQAPRGERRRGHGQPHPPRSQQRRAGEGREGKAPAVYQGTKNEMKDWVDVPSTKVGDLTLYDVGTYHDAEEGKKIGKNAAFVYEADGMRLVHLGDLGQEKLTAEQVRKIGKVDVVMIPVGGKFTIDAAGAGRI